MNIPYNRIAFKNDIDAIYRKVVIPFQHRYVTYQGRAVIFLWAARAMYGDFASLLDEVRAEYPVAFIGSVGLMQMPSDASALKNSSALDGFMPGRRRPGTQCQSHTPTSSYACPSIRR